MTPSPAVDPSQVATSIVTWSGFVLAGFSFLLTVFTAFLLLAGLFGLREIRNIRRAGQEASDQTRKVVTDANSLLVQLREEVAAIDGRMNSLVEVSYLFNQGEMAYRGGNYPKAVDFLERAVMLDSRNPRVLYRLGRALTNAGHDLAASERFKEMQGLGSSTGDWERGLAWVYRYSDPEQALRYANEATSADSANHRNWNCLGIIQRDAGNIVGSARSHEKAGKLEPNAVVTPFYLSLLRARQGAEERARKDCGAAIYRLGEQEHLSPVKSIWSDLILWAGCIFAGEYDRADGLSASLAATCTSRRRAREVGGHVDFLLRSLKRESLLSRYLAPIEREWPPQLGE
jgi:tetratricopeptide (TPR) repeat protein